MKVKFVSIYESTMYINDDEFKIDYYRDNHNQYSNLNYEELIKVVNEFKFSDEEIEEIDELKKSYYQSDFWVDTEYFMDNISGITWNFYYDITNKEIIINK